MSVEDEEIQLQLLEYNYAQAPIAWLGSIASSLLVAAFIARGGWQDALGPWLAGHAIATTAGMLTWRHFRPEKLRRSPLLALSMRRAGIVSLGSLWGAAALLWPLSTGNTGIGVLLCATGLAAAASSTSSADPRGVLIFIVLAFLPPLLIEAPNDAWLSGLLILYLTAITVVSLRNHQVLKLSLSLRWTNSLLLEQARAEQKATFAAKQRAEAAVAARTRFIAAASHDLRQPVQAMSLFADVLAHQTDEVKRNEVIAALGRTSLALSAMLESLLDISRLDAGIAAPRPSSLAIARMLEDIASGLQGEAEARGMVVQVAGRACQVFCDRTMLARVVQNLASNAVRHGAGRVLLSSRKRGDHCLVQIWDQGPGIAERDQERIFEELVQLENPERDRQKGLGIGLSMVRRLCDLNHWKLSVRSRLGRGSVFSVELPLAGSDHAPRLRSQPPEMRAIRVLLVEDDRDVRTASLTFLEGRGCQVFAAANANEAREIWRRQSAAGSPPELLITDHGLPGDMSGAALALILRAEQPYLPVLVVTGAATLPFGDEPPAGVVVLRKPVKGDLLWRTLRDALDARDLPAAPKSA